MDDLGEGEAPPQEAELSVQVLESVKERQHLVHLGDLSSQSDLHVGGGADRRSEEGDAETLTPGDAPVQWVCFPVVRLSWLRVAAPAGHPCLWLWS